MPAKQTKRRTVKHILRSALLVLMVVSLLQFDLFEPTASAVTQAEIDQLKNNADGLSSEKKDLQKQIDALKDDKDDAIEKKTLLDQQSAVIRQEITNVEAQISAYEELIAQTKRELEETEQREEEQYELFCRRVRAMEENGAVSYWSVLFNATDFADLLGRLDFVSEIIEYDQGVMDTLQQLRTAIDAKKADLEAQLSEQEAARDELKAKKAELDKQVAEAAALVAEIQKNEEAAKALLSAKEAEARRIDQLIKEKEAELAASLGPASVGGYIWPENVSKRITSPMGSRNTGIPGASTNHKGVDIGGVGYTTSVLATKAGVVIISERSSSYGEYVVISHGAGNSTTYAHMSQRKVKVGQTVKQGQVIGITGSTGISSGPHLHYEIVENNVRVDPLKYLPGYIKAW